MITFLSHLILYVFAYFSLLSDNQNEDDNTTMFCLLLLRLCWVTDRKRERERGEEKEGQTFGDERLIEKDKFEFFFLLFFFFLPMYIVQHAAFHYCITLRVSVVLTNIAAVAVVVTLIQGLYIPHICCSHKCKSYNLNLS